MKKNIIKTTLILLQLLTTGYTQHAHANEKPTASYTPSSSAECAGIFNGDNPIQIVHDGELINHCLTDLTLYPNKNQAEENNNANNLIPTTEQTTSQPPQSGALTIYTRLYYDSPIKTAAEPDRNKTRLPISSEPTKLLLAVKNNNYKEVQRLLKEKENPNIAYISMSPWSGTGLGKYDLEGASPLSYAVANEQADIVLLLLKNGADPNTYSDKKLYGDTPLMCAAWWHENPEITQLLLEYGANPNLADDMNDQTALMIALACNHLKTAQTLLNNKNTNPNITSKLGYSALTEAINNNHSDFAKLLLEKNVDPNARNSAKETLLMRAVEKNQPEIVQILLKEKNVSPNTVHICGYTAYTLAKEKNYRDIMQMLIDAGADTNIGILPHQSTCTPRFSLSRAHGGAYQARIAEALARSTPSSCSISKEDAEYFATAEGSCYGFSVVWLYSQWLQFVHPEKVKNYGYNDLFLFKNLVADTIGNRVNCDNVRNFAHLVKEFQLAQLNPLEETMSTLHLDTCGEKLQKKSQIKVPLVLEGLKRTLKENMINEHELVLIHYDRHAAAAFKDKNKYYYFDSAGWYDQAPHRLYGDFAQKWTGGGQTIVDSTDALAELLLKENKPTATQSSTLLLEIFSFNKKAPGPHKEL